ncbi:MAG: tyrosine-type recombinase/integrase [Bryobacteraceae bacterium]
MMADIRATVHMLAGGPQVTARVQHPQVKPRKNRQGWPWVFRYWSDEMQPDGSLKSLRKYQALGPSKGEGAITRKEAEVERDKLLAKLNAPTVDAAVQQVAITGVAFFLAVAQIYTDGYLAREDQISRPTREKETFYLREYIVPQWGTLRLNEIQPKAIEDWLHATFDSWWTMHGVRAIMNRVFNHAEGHGLWEQGKRSPSSRANLGKKHCKYERRILSFEETARVLARLEITVRLVIEICIATGARISEVLGLTWRHVNLDAGTIKIAQRVWHQEVGRPKSEGSKRDLGVGDLVERLQAKAAEDVATPDSFVFQQKRAPGKPLWDSGVRDALHQAAQAEGCDFPRLGPHSFRRANITWRQQVGGSAIEASKIAGHSDLEMTGEYTFVTPERQNELTRRIQQKLGDAAGKNRKQNVLQSTVLTSVARDASSTLERALPQPAAIVASVLPQPTGAENALSADHRN